MLWNRGTEKFRAVVPAYLRGADIVIIVFDVTDKNSFEQIPMWVRMARNHAKTNAVFALCGNKCDLQNRCVATRAGQQCADDIHATFFETSVWGSSHMFVDVRS